MVNGGHYSIGRLVELVNDWCRTHQVQPLDNRAGTEVTIRNIRYYQSLGLVDRPVNANGTGFTEKHRRQLIAIRLLQAKGLPLSRIQSLLYGRSNEDLEEIERRALAEEAPYARSGSAFMHAAKDWQAVPLSEDVMLLTRLGREVTAAQRQRIMDILAPAPQPETAADDNSFRPEYD